jgi:hypothetical protein
VSSFFVDGINRTSTRSADGAIELLHGRLHRHRIQKS